MGVVGAGMVSQVAHLPAIAAAPGARLAAIADLDADLARRVADRHGAAKAYEGHRALLADPDIDAVVVVTHRRLTGSIVHDALAAGKAVLSEKPMAFTAEAARELAALAASRDVAYAVGFMKRHDAGVARAKALLASAKADRRMGGLLAVRAKNFCGEYVGEAPDTFAGTAPKPELPRPGFPAGLEPGLEARYEWFANVGLHTLNLLRFLLDDPLAVRHAAFGGADGFAFAAMLAAGEVPVTVEAGRAATGRWEEGVEIFFERGRIEIVLTGLRQGGLSAAVALDENAGEARTTRWGHGDAGPWAFDRQMQAFVRAAAGDRQALLAPAADGVRDLELLEDIFRNVQGNDHG